MEPVDDSTPPLIRLAEREARRVNHEYVGTEHVLLALLRDKAGVAARICKNVGVDPNDIRAKVEAILDPGLSPPPPARLPTTPRVKRAVELAIEEARGLNHKLVGVEHLLLGLLREGDGIAALVLQQMGVRLGAVRREIQRLGSTTL
jgi:ATP-dependent Clp protease ATP-binding subunit ClpC